MLAHAPPSHGVGFQFSSGGENTFRAPQLLHQGEQVGFEAGFAAFTGDPGGKEDSCASLGKHAAGVVAQAGDEAELRVAAAAGAPPAEQPIGNVE